MSWIGGRPDSSDILAPSIFLGAYIITLPVLFWRWTPKQRLVRFLVPVSLALGCQIGMLIMRIIMYRIEYSKMSLLASSVLMDFAYFILIVPVIDICQMSSSNDTDKPRRWVKIFSWIFDLALAASLTLSLVGNIRIIQLSRYDTYGSHLIIIRNLRRASSVLTMSILITLEFITISSHLKSRNIRRAIYISTILLLLAVIAIYHILNSFTPYHPDRIGWSPLGFWILKITFEYLVYIVLLGAPLREMFVISPIRPEYFPVDSLDTPHGKVQQPLDTPKLEKGEFAEGGIEMKPLIPSQTTTAYPLPLYSAGPHSTS